MQTTSEVSEKSHLGGRRAVAPLASRLQQKRRASFAGQCGTQHLPAALRDKVPSLGLNSGENHALALTTSCVVPTAVASASENCESK